jgi:SpoVK/Ycf46/Vps4 family AAA+-type ATPase
MLLVRSFAKKFNLAMYDMRASAITSKSVGESEKFVWTLFDDARTNSPAILRLDECGGLLCNPSADAEQSHNYRLLQNQLKNRWSDHISSQDEVIVIGATNKPHDIHMDGFGGRLSLKLYAGTTEGKRLPDDSQELPRPIVGSMRG